MTYIVSLFSFFAFFSCCTTAWLIVPMDRPEISSTSSVAVTCSRTSKPPRLRGVAEFQVATADEGLLALGELCSTRKERVLRGIVEVRLALKKHGDR